MRTSTPYIRSKTIAERAAWEFVAQDDTPKLAVVNPVGIFGPTLGQDYSSSIALIKSLLDGAMPATPRMSFGAVDVRDVAGLVLPRPAKTGQSTAHPKTSTILVDTVAIPFTPRGPLAASKAAYSFGIEMKAKRLMLGMTMSLLIFVGYARSAIGDESQPLLSSMKQILPLAQKGDAKSEDEVGAIFASGQGEPQDFQEAAKWFRRAAEQGYGPAEFNLGQLYQAGKGVAADSNEAAKWITLAAEQGIAVAQAKLAAMYLTGSGVAQSDTEAAKWYGLAAHQGNTIAERQLGLMYALGRGLPRSDDDAIQWLERAARSGDIVAKEKLAMLPLSKGASEAIDPGYASQPPRDASSPQAAVAMMEGMLRGADTMENRCIQLHPDLRVEIDRDYFAWKSNEAVAIDHANKQWAAQKTELKQTADSIATSGAQASVDRIDAVNGSVGSTIWCKKYFSDLASGVWRQRTPQLYQFLDAMP